MRNKSVAVLDIRSAEIVAAVAQKGVNNTFILKSKYALPYDGFAPLRFRQSLEYRRMTYMN